MLTNSYAWTMGIIWTVGMLAIVVTGMVFQHRRQNAKLMARSGGTERLDAIAAQLTDLQARVAKIEKVLASVD